MKYGLIGEKLGHSFSKQIHESLNDYKYELVELSKEEFDDFMIKKDFTAINVTIPYKEKVIPYLDYIDSTAEEIHAVNTIVNKNGKLYGYNTDYLGLKDLIIKNNINVLNKKALILGTGGTSKTATVVLKKLGIKEIIYASRNKKENTITYDDIYKHKDIQIIINTTPVGMYPNINKSLINLDQLNDVEAVIDVIYNPLKTKLIIDAEERNIKTATGLYMLVSQAVYASSIFLNKNIEKSIQDNIYNKILKEKRNIVLIGMPSCGKTSIAMELKRILSKEFIDTDFEIEKRINKKIKDYLTEENEEEFRDIESLVVEDISLLNNKVISTGGGIIKRKKNIDLLKANGLIIFIDRDINKLNSTTTRPLSSTKEKLVKLYNERYQTYISYADIVIKNDDEFIHTINKILESI